MCKKFRLIQIYFISHLYTENNVISILIYIYIYESKELISLCKFRKFDINNVGNKML